MKCTVKGGDSKWNNGLDAGIDGDDPSGDGDVGINGGTEGQPGVDNGTTAKIGGDGDSVAGELIIHSFDGLVRGYAIHLDEDGVHHTDDEFVDSGSHQGKF